MISGSGSRPDDVVICDMMAGVGPFAVPLARRGHPVFANDLNPDSYKALGKNGARNKCEGRLSTSNACGREFARDLIEKGQVRFLCSVLLKLRCSRPEATLATKLRVESSGRALVLDMGYLRPEKPGPFLAWSQVHQLVFRRY